MGVQGTSPNKTEKPAHSQFLLLFPQQAPLFPLEIQQEELDDVQVHLLALVFSQDIAFTEKHKGEKICHWEDREISYWYYRYFSERKTAVLRGCISTNIQPMPFQKSKQFK